MKAIETSPKFYRDVLGWNIVPVVHGTKRPKVDWKPFQDRRTTADEFQRHFENEDGVGAICGPTSGNLGVLDFDQPEAYNLWREQNDAWTSKVAIASTGRGFHVFFRTLGVERKRDFYVEGFSGKAGEFLGHGSFVVLPPTRHPSGVERVWLQLPDEGLPTVELSELGISFKPKDSSSNFGPDIFALNERSFRLDRSLPTGSRHDGLLSYASSLRARGLVESEIGQLVETANRQNCIPPLESTEVAGIVRWAAQKSVGVYHHPYSPEYGMTSQQNFGQLGVTHTHPLGDDDEDARFGHLFKSLPEYLEALPTDGYEWIVEGFMPRGYLTVVGGDSKAGKSVLLTALCMAVAAGEPFLGMETTQGSVLWLAFEESEGERGANLRKYEQQPDNIFLTHEKLYIDTEEGMAAIRYWIRRTNASLVIVDPLYGATQVDSLSDGRKARSTLSGLKDLCRAENISTFLIHHMNKNVQAGISRERMADSNQILATASSDILVESCDEADGSRTLTLHGRGRGAFANQNWTIHSKSETQFELISSGKPGEAAQDAILDQLKMIGCATADELATQLKMNPATVRNRLTRMAKEGKVTPAGKTSSRATVWTVNSNGVLVQV